MRYLPPSSGPERTELCRDRRNVCLAARFLSLSPHAVNRNIKPAENQQATILYAAKKQVAADSAKIFEDRFLFEEGVCHRHMTDEKRNIDQKDCLR